jgi:hypothetical protein
MLTFSDDHCLTSAQLRTNEEVEGNVLKLVPAHQIGFFKYAISSEARPEALFLCAASFNPW